MTLQKLELYKNVLERYNGEYTELLDNWRDLERKSQGAIAVSGILLAGIFGIVAKAFDIIKEHHIFFIALTLLSLVASIVYALRVLRTTRVLTAPRGEDLQLFVFEMLEATQIDGNGGEDRLLGFIGDQCRIWKNANQDIRDKNEIKAAHLSMALSFTVYALVSILIVTLLIIVEKYGG